MTDIDAKARAIAFSRHTTDEAYAESIAIAIREAVAAEREACATLAREINFPDDCQPSWQFIEGWESACAHIAKAIRARSNEDT